MRTPASEVQSTQAPEKKAFTPLGNVFVQTTVVPQPEVELGAAPPVAVTSIAAPRVPSVKSVQLSATRTPSTLTYGTVACPDRQLELPERLVE
jgi:hypothetical protein